MENFFKIIRGQYGLSIKLFILFFIGGLAYLVTGQTGAFISLRSPHPFWLNVFFINYTFLVSSLFALALSVYHIFFKQHKNRGILLFMGCFFTAVIIQLIKNFNIPGNFAIYSEPLQNLFFHFEMPGEDYVLFPSAYTATAFTIVNILILNEKVLYRKLILLFAAALVGFSRLYLVQNSLPDVFIGAATGIFSAATVVCLQTAAGVLRKAKVGYFRSRNNSSPATHHAM